MRIELELTEEEAQQLRSMLFTHSKSGTSRRSGYALAVKVATAISFAKRLEQLPIYDNSDSEASDLSRW